MNYLFSCLLKTLPVNVFLIVPCQRIYRLEARHFSIWHHRIQKLIPLMALVDFHTGRANATRKSKQLQAAKTSEI
jgi:hypothetical protein